MIQETSKEAYKDVKSSLGMRHKQVILALVTLKRANNREIAQYLNMPINCITGRVNELRKMNRIEQDSIKVDNITKRPTIKWRLI